MARVIFPDSERFIKRYTDPAATKMFRGPDMMERANKIVGFVDKMAQSPALTAAVSLVGSAAKRIGGSFEDEVYAGMTDEEKQMYDVMTPEQQQRWLAANARIASTRGVPQQEDMSTSTSGYTQGSGEQVLPGATGTLLPTYIRQDPGVLSDAQKAAGHYYGNDPKTLEPIFLENNAAQPTQPVQPTLLADDVWTKLGKDPKFMEIATGKGLMKVNSRGPSVVTLQQFLADSGFYKGKVDGIYGKNTSDAVKDWQTSQGINPDGIVGGATSREILSAVGINVVEPETNVATPNGQTNVVSSTPPATSSAIPIPSTPASKPNLPPPEVATPTTDYVAKLAAAGNDPAARQKVLDRAAQDVQARAASAGNVSAPETQPTKYPTVNKTEIRQELAKPATLSDLSEETPEDIALAEKYGVDAATVTRYRASQAIRPENINTETDVMAAAHLADTPEKQRIVIESINKMSFAPRNVFEALGFGSQSIDSRKVDIAKIASSVFPKKTSQDTYFDLQLKKEKAQEIAQRNKGAAEKLPGQVAQGEANVAKTDAGTTATLEGARKTASEIRTEDYLRGAKLAEKVSDMRNNAKKLDIAFMKKIRSGGGKGKKNTKFLAQVYATERGSHTGVVNEIESLNGKIAQLDAITTSNSLTPEEEQQITNFNSKKRPGYPSGQKAYDAEKKGVDVLKAKNDTKTKAETEARTLNGQKTKLVNTAKQHLDKMQKIATELGVQPELNVTVPTDEN